LINKIESVISNYKKCCDFWGESLLIAFLIVVDSALAELGKATQDKAQTPPLANIHIVDEKTKEPKPKKAKNKTDKYRQ
jgi:hypothetical protein